MLSAAIEPWFTTVILKFTFSPGLINLDCPGANFLYRAKSKDSVMISSLSWSSSSPPFLPSPLMSLSTKNLSLLLASGSESISTCGLLFMSVAFEISAQLVIVLFAAKGDLSFKVMSTYTS